LVIATEDNSETQISRGAPEFARTQWALFAAGFTTFGLLYYVQSLLPIFSEVMDVTPAQSSLALSLTTGVMAFALLFAGAVSDAVGRKRIMALSMAASSALTLAMAFTPNWGTILAIRLLMGLTLSGVQSVSMAYLSEEVAPRSFGGALGLFIAGSAMGGMFGRIIASVIADLAGWRAAVGCMGVAGLIAAGFFQLALPKSRHFVPRAPGIARLFRDLREIVSDSVQLRLCLVGFAIMSCFVTTYNFITFRLVAPPFDLSQTAVGLVFVLYVFGSFGASYAGVLSSRYGPRRLLWVMSSFLLIGGLLTLPQNLVAVIAGLSVLTFGMFATHSVASSWVGARARTSRALAASVYLFAYYQGGSLVGATGGLFWQSGGWVAVVGLTSAIAIFGMGLALSLLWVTRGESGPTR